jgi:hypothetical protein
MMGCLELLIQRCMHNSTRWPQLLFWSLIRLSVLFPWVLIVCALMRGLEVLRYVIVSGLYRRRNIIFSLATRCVVVIPRILTPNLFLMRADLI